VTLGDGGHQASVKVSCLGLGLEGLGLDLGGYVSGLGLVGPGLVNIPDGHVQQREDDSCVKKIMKAEVYGRWSHGRLKKRWSDMVQQDMVTLRLKSEDAADRQMEENLCG